jgi:hypothetical protein
MWWSKAKADDCRLNGLQFAARPSLAEAPTFSDDFVRAEVPTDKPGMSWRSLLLCLIFLAAIPAHATTYYVAAAGSDSNSGTDTGHPWQTIGKVNGSTFSAGDSILFNRGDVWYGTSLIGPSSGSSGSPITFVAYGSGANPVIKGTEAGIGPAATAPNTSSMTRITWGGGSNGTTVAAGAAATSDAITYSLNNSVDQIVTIYTTARNVEYFTDNNETLWSNFSAPDQSQSTSVTGYTTGGNVVISTLTSIQTTLYTYRNTLGTAPVAVWENGSLMTLAVNPAGVDLNAKSWYYDGTYLYLHAADGSNISTNGKKYTYVTASSPSFTTWDNAQRDLIFDGLDQAETWNTSSTTLGGLYFTGSNNIARNFVAHDAYRHPITVYIGATNNLVTNATAYNSYSTSPLAIYGTGTTGNLVQNSTFYNDTTLQTAYPGGAEVWSVIVFHGDWTSNTVDSCLIYSTAASAGGYGILIGDSGTTGTVSHSKLYGTYGWAVDSGTGGNSGLGAGSTITLYGNLIDTSQANHVGLLFTGSTGNTIYNNTVYGPLNTNAAISEASTSTGGSIKNNIFLTGGYIAVDATSETGAAIDYNDYYSASGTPFSWGGTAYTLANWKTNSSQDSHSLNSDPTLTSEASLSSSGNFTLLPGSPAINAGTNLGSTYQNGLAAASAWPGGVAFVNQNTAGSGWEIGGYVFQVNGSTLLLRGCCD